MKVEYFDWCLIAAWGICTFFLIATTVCLFIMIFKLIDVIIIDSNCKEKVVDGKEEV